MMRRRGKEALLAYDNESGNDLAASGDIDALTESMIPPGVSFFRQHRSAGSGGGTFIEINNQSQTSREMMHDVVSGFLRRLRRRYRFENEKGAIGLVDQKNNLQCSINFNFQKIPYELIVLPLEGEGQRIPLTEGMSSDVLYEILQRYLPQVSEKDEAYNFQPLLEKIRASFSRSNTVAREVLQSHSAVSQHRKDIQEGSFLLDEGSIETDGEALTFEVMYNGYLFFLRITPLVGGRAGESYKAEIEHADKPKYKTSTDISGLDKISGIEIGMIRLCSQLEVERKRNELVQHFLDDVVYELGDQYTLKRGGAEWSIMDAETPVALITYGAGYYGPILTAVDSQGRTICKDFLLSSENAVDNFAQELSDYFALRHEEQEA